MEEIIEIFKIQKGYLQSKQLISRKIELIINIPDSTIYTLGNKYRLEQVILNLLSNAGQAVDEKSKLTETNKFIKQVSVDLFENKNYVIITINDNGIGIKKSIFSKMPLFNCK